MNLTRAVVRRGRHSIQTFSREVGVREESPVARPARPTLARPAQVPLARLARSAVAWRRVRLPRLFWPLLRTVAGLGLLGLLLRELGAGPFLAGLRLIDGPVLAVAIGIGALTTVCCAWRWSLVAGGLGVALPLRTAVAHCYRSVFLNATLPGGVVGDVHRAVRHGRDAGDVGRGIRAVVWERTAGQLVQAAIAVVVLLVFPSPVRPRLPVALGLVAAVLCAVLLVRFLSRTCVSRTDVSRTGVSAGLRPRTGPGRGWARGSRALRTARADVRAGLLARRTWAGVLVASALVVVGHLATFLLAARTAGATAPLSLLLPLTLLALLAMGVPANVGGFGPREGVAAWAFGAAGLTAAQGVATAMVYGALVLAASLPGAAVLIVRRIGRPVGVLREDTVGS